MKSNFIVKIIGVCIIAAVLVIVIKGGKNKSTSSDNQQGSNLSEIESGPMQVDNGLSQEKLDEKWLEQQGVEADTPKETMRTLTNEMALMRKQSEKLNKENKELKQRIDLLLKMEDQVNMRVDGNLKRTELSVKEKQQQFERTQQESQNLLQQLQAKVNEYTTGKKNGTSTSSGYRINDAGIPEGFGYDDNGVSINYDEIVWIDPLDSTVDKKGGIQLPNFISSRVEESIENNSIVNQMPSAQQNKKDNLIKAYTIPKNGTLIGSVSMTALIGRIPSAGAIQDPYPFKVIVGKENLSSNGISIPNVSGIMMSGVATGDWTLSCVSGKILSMTFTFEDGTISTYPDPDQEENKPIAWISDDNGVPCVTGERITNAASFLAQRIGLSTAAAYADARAAAETSSFTNGNGASRSVTGDPSTYAQNTAIGDGLQETGDWLEKRQSSSFDAIYAHPGTRISIHLSKEIKIDYDKDGRKVDHYAKVQRHTDNYLD